MKDLKILVFERIAFIYLVLMILSNTAIVNIGSTGVPLFYLTTLFLAIVFVKPVRIDFKFKLFIFLNFISLFIPITYHFYFNGNKLSDVTQLISRLLLLLCFGVGIVLLEYLHLESYKRVFRLFLKFLSVIWLYGIYEFIAKILNLPIPLEGVANSVSFTTVDNAFGWSNTFRIRSLWSEPSFSAIPILIYMFLLNTYEVKRKRKKILFMMLAGLYSFLTFSRVVWFVFVISLIIYFLPKNFKRYRIYSNNNVISTLAIALLFLILISIGNSWVYFVRNYFSDLSSSGRSMSALVGFSIWIDHFLWGTGFNTFSEFKNSYISNFGFVHENFCHSLVPNYLYQIGVWGFLYVGSFMYILFEKIKGEFGTLFYILIFFYCGIIGGDIFYQSSSWVFVLIFCLVNKRIQENGKLYEAKVMEL